MGRFSPPAQDPAPRWALPLAAASALFLFSLYAFFLIRGPRLPLAYDGVNCIYESLRMLSNGTLAFYSHGSIAFLLCGGLHAAWFLGLKILGEVSGSADYLVYFLLRIGWFVTAVEVFVGLFGLALLAQLFRIGRLFGGPAVGALACLLCATNLTFVAMTSFFKEDIFYWFFLLAAMELAWRAAEDLSFKHAVGAGVALGLSMASKYFGIFGFLLCLLPPAVAAAGERGRALKVGAAMAVSGAVSFLVFFPFLFTDPGNFIGTIRNMESVTSPGAMERAIWHYPRFHIRDLTGWAVAVVGALEWLRRWIKEPRGPVLLSLPALATVIFVGSRMGYSQTYHGFVLALFFFVLAPSGLWALLSPGGGTRRWIAVAAVGLTVAWDSSYLGGTLRYALRLTGPETRLQAREYLEAHASPGDRILINNAIVGDNFFGPPVVPSNRPQGHGPFTRALNAADALRPGPQFELKMVDLRSPLGPADWKGCDWAVIGRWGAHPDSQFAPVFRNPEVPDRAPPGFERVADFPAYPEAHTHHFPILTSLDYDSIRKASWSEIMNRRALGMSFAIYRRSKVRG